jgi:hypothetical protein
MIPADQKQLNIAFPTLTMSLSRGEIQNTAYGNSFILWLQNFRNDKLLYSGWGQLCI